MSRKAGLYEYAIRELSEDSGETCHNCARRLTVSELLADKCRLCGAKPSENPREAPF